MSDKKLTMGQLAALMKAAAKKVDPETDKGLKGLAQVGTGLMKKEIQNVHAVDTSTMLNSVTAESEGRKTVIIGPTVDYAAYVALGTSKRAARPFHLTATQQLNKQAGLFGFDAGDLGI